MKIVLADDQADVRSALRIVIEQETEFDVVGEAEEPGKLLAQVQKEKPEMVLLDWELSPSGMADLIAVLKRLCPGVKIVALSGRPEARRAAMMAEADAFVSKGDPPERLLEVLGGKGAKA